MYYLIKTNLILGLKIKIYTYNLFCSTKRKKPYNICNCCSSFNNSKAPTDIVQYRLQERLQTRFLSFPSNFACSVSVVPCAEQRERQVGKGGNGWLVEALFIAASQPTLLTFFLSISPMRRVKLSRPGFLFPFLGYIPVSR